MRRVVALLLFIAVSACGGGGPTNPGGNGVTNFTAKIDGADWNAEYPVTAINGGAGLYSITALRVTGSNAYTLVFSLNNITGPGTYPLGVGVFVFGGTALISQVGTDGWSTPLTGAAGQIVITTLSATQMVGTFEFVATPLQGGGASKTVTQGVFDIPVSGTGGLAAANQGSSVTGTVGGTFVASSALATLAGATPTLTVVADNGVRGVSFSLANMTGANTYAVSTSAPVRTIQVSGAPGIPGAGWTSALAGGSGSVIITSVTASRVLGTFTATVIPFPGSGAVGNLTISGTFSLARL